MIPRFFIRSIKVSQGLWYYFSWSKVKSSYPTLRVFKKTERKTGNAYQLTLISNLVRRPAQVGGLKLVSVFGFGFGFGFASGQGDGDGDGAVVGAADGDGGSAVWGF